MRPAVRARLSATLLGAFATLSCPLPVAADTLEAQLRLDGKLPLAGILYARERNFDAQAAVIDQVGKRFTHRIAVTSPGSSLAFLNSDAFDHNIYANVPASNAIFDIGLMPAGSMASLAVEWTPDSLVRIGCKIHPRMRAYIANVPANRHGVLEPERGRREYHLEVREVPVDAGPVVLLLAGFEPVSANLARGNRVEVGLVRRGKPAGTVLLVRR